MHDAAIYASQGQTTAAQPRLTCWKFKRADTNLETKGSDGRFGIWYAPEAVVCFLAFGRLFPPCEGALSHCHSQKSRHGTLFLLSTLNNSQVEQPQTCARPDQLSHSIAGTVQFADFAYRWQDLALLIRPHLTGAGSLPSPIFSGYHGISQE